MSDPDRPLYEIQRTVRGGQAAQLLPAKGGPAWSRSFLGDAAAATVDKDGFYKIEAFDDYALVELARDLPVAAYRIHGRVRHNKTLQTGYAGLYVGGRSADAAGLAGHLFSRCEYNEDQRHHQTPAAQRAVVVPPGNPIHLVGLLYVVRDQAPPWGHGFGGTSGIYVKPSGLAADVWRDLEIVVRPESLQAAFDGAPLQTLDFATFEPIFQRQFAAIVAKEPAQRDFLRKLPARFDPQGSLGLLVSQSSASFADFAVTPLKNPGANQ